MSPPSPLDAEWCLLASLAQLGWPGGQSAYLRLSTRPVNQALAAVPPDPAARERRRRQVVAGGYPLRRSDHPAVTIAAMGAVATEASAAADRPGAMGVVANLIRVTSPDLLFRALEARQGRLEAPTWILDSSFRRHHHKVLSMVRSGQRPARGDGPVDVAA